MAYSQILPILQLKMGSRQQVSLVINKFLSTAKLVKFEREKKHHVDFIPGPSTQTQTYQKTSYQTNPSHSRFWSREAREVVNYQCPTTVTCGVKRVKSSTSWTCSIRSKKLGCLATVTQNGDHFIRGPQRHDYPPDLKLPLR